MANYELGQDLLLLVQQRLGDALPSASTPNTDGDFYTRATDELNQAYREITALRPWRWARVRQQFTSVGEHTGEVVEVDGTIITLGDAPADSKTGFKFMFDREAVPHRIQLHNAEEETLALQTEYAGDETTGPYTIFQDELTVGADLGGHLVVKELHSGSELRPASERELDYWSPRNTLGHEIAWRYAQLSERVIRITPWTIQPRLFEAVYNVEPDALTFDGVVETDTPLLPKRYRVILAHRALETLYPDKRDARITIAQQQVQDLLKQMERTEIVAGQARRFVKPGQGGWGRSPYR